MSRNFQEHPDESTVLRFLDGELSEREAAELRSHLDGCWQCRRDLGEWQGTIDAFLRLRDTVLAANDPPPPNPWLPIDQLYAGPAEPAPTRWWVFWKMAAVTAAVLAAVLAATLAVRKPTAPSTPPRVNTPTIATPPTAPAAGTLPAAANENAPAPVVDSGFALHSQVLAAQALHELGADLGEPVTVVPTSTGALVRDDGLDERRQGEIRAAVAKLPGVVFTGPEARAKAGVHAMTAGAASTVREAARPKLYEAQLTSRLGGAAGVEAFANSILDDSDAVTVRAHAIQSLEGLFPRRAALAAADGRVVDGILSTHRAVLRTRVASLRERLGPLLAGSPGPPGTASLPALAARARELDRLLNAAFAGARLPISDDELAGRIQGLLKELEQ